MKSTIQFKKLLLLLLVFTFSATVTFGQNCGDINADGSTDIVDALLVAQCYVGLISCPSADIGDVNCDRARSIDIVDALLIAQLYVGLISTLDCCGIPTETPDPDPTPGEDVTLELQAETDATWDDAAVESDHSGYTGTGYVNTANSEGRWIEWTVDVSKECNAVCVFTYATSGSGRPMDLSVNGNLSENLSFPDTGAWTTWSTETANIILNAGSNAIRLTATSSEGAGNIDKMDITISGGEVVTPTPIPSPTPVPTCDGTCPPVPYSDELIGYAAVSGNGVDTTTGGGNATPQVITTFEDLENYGGDETPRVLHISGRIATTSYAFKIGSNKTVIGVDKNATIYGGLEMNGVSNVIIRNLNIEGTWPNSGPDDTLASRNSHHIWYDHLNVWNATDGILDITKESDYHTVSWCKFWYTDSSHGHRYASLNGSGGGDHPEDWGKLRVTYHHNWWAERVDSRMPRVVYGCGHQFNNYFNSPGNSYCIGVGSYGSILVENNYFKNVNNPHQFMYDVYMYAEARGNIYDNTSGKRDEGYGGSRDACPDGDCSVHADCEPGPIDIPYTYTPDPAEDVPDIVMSNAGPR